jgi:hypothetical protein
VSDISRESARAVLAVPMGDNDAEAATIGEYLTKLLQGVWEDRDGFDGKRPFGNSSWEGEVYIALVEAGLVAGVMDDDSLEYMEDCDEQYANRLVDAAIQEMGQTWSTPCAVCTPQTGTTGSAAAVNGAHIQGNPMSSGAPAGPSPAYTGSVPVPQGFRDSGWAR